MSTAVMSMFWCGQLSKTPSRGMPPALQMASLFLVPLQQLFSASNAHRATSMFFFFFVVRLARLGISCRTWTWGPQRHSSAIVSMRWVLKVCHNAYESTSEYCGRLDGSSNWSDLNEKTHQFHNTAVLPDDPPCLPELGHVGNGLCCQSLELLYRIQQLHDALKTPLADYSSEDFLVETNSDQDLQRSDLMQKSDKPSWSNCFFFF